MAAPTNAAYVKKALANSEPSTHGCTDQCCLREESSCQLGAVHTCCLREESSCQLGAVHTWHFSAAPAAPGDVRFQGVKQPCRRNPETAEVDPDSDIGPG